MDWPSSSKLAQLLCHVEKKFAKHIGPEEFVQCSQNLIKEEPQQSNYDVPASSILFSSSSAATTSVTATTSNLLATVQPQQIQSDLQQTSAAGSGKKKTCNLENYFEWSSRLRLLVANEILLVSEWNWIIGVSYVIGSDNRAYL